MDTELLNKRIEQWEHMTQEDPENAMGWFSLGNAYKQADRDEQAARAYRKAVELDPGFSRAYQSLGQILMHEGANEQAIDILTTGYKAAAEQGDVMPQRAMEALLNKLGAEVPLVKSSEPAAAPPEAGDGAIIDRRTGQRGVRMSKPPFKGPIGQFIADHYSQETWREWISHGTKVINELRLDLSNPEHQEVYDQHMLEWLGFTEAEAQHYAEQQQSSS